MENVNSLSVDDYAPLLYIGQHESHRMELVNLDLVRLAHDIGYDILTTPITTNRFQSRILNTLEEHIHALNSSSQPDTIPTPLIPPLSPQDTNLVPEDSNASLIAVASPWLDLGSPDPLIAHISRQVLNLEIEYAAFCGINTILVIGPSSSEATVQYGRAILDALGLGPYIHLHILMPMAGELEQDVSDDTIHLSELARDEYTSTAGIEIVPELYGPWETWSTIRTLCSYNPRLTVALELPRQLPPVTLQSRWYSEPVKLLLIPRTSFMRNAKGYPVLSKNHQLYITRFCRLRFPPWILLSDVGPIFSEATKVADGVAQEPTPAEAAKQVQGRAEDSALHLKYMRHLQQTQPPRPPMEKFGQGYQDYLQSPLQPLSDNLESITYELFEKDPVKYEWYERAIALALKDLHTKLQSGRAINVAVVGAGRGPLVSRGLLASQKTGIPVKCFAVEKNPNAHVLLQRRNVTDPLWNNRVTVVKSDMRSWLGPTGSKDGGDEIGKVDILVSELLGSFADNELSPECLDGVQHVLHPEHGISIPQSYSAHLTPIASPKIYGDILPRASSDLNMTVDEKWQIPYVVMLHQYDFLSLQAASEGGNEDIPNIQQSWTFSHPAPHAALEQARKRIGGTLDAGGSLGGDGNNEHNSRSCRLRFRCQNRGICHGLAGYFETILYRSTHDAKDVVELSTNPLTMERKSKDMISWFPIFFPLKNPLYVPDNGDVEVSMWRQTDDRKVWYEWIVEVFDSSNGQPRKSGMSDLHSSRRNGCLM